jgi:hypothetical protein
MKYIVVLFLAGFAAGCGSDSGGTDAAVPADMSIVDLTPFVGADLLPVGDAAVSPITVTADQWTFVPINGAMCDDGSQTGIGVNPGASDKLLFFFEGGGACGDYQTCYQFNTAAHGPFTATNFAGGPPENASLLSRSDGNNPFAAYTMVYVPYCTGDLHSGIRVAQYSNGTDNRMYHHNGHINVLRALDRLGVTWPNLTSLAVTGASAGGYGALLNYNDIRLRWPSAKSLLIDDSGPTLEAASTSSFLNTWIAAWGVFDWLGVYCSECSQDPGFVPTSLGRLNPNDNLALLSSLQDTTIRSYYLLPGPDFETALRKMAADHIDPQPRFHRFFIDGSSHTMLGSPSSAKVGNVSLWTWINQMASDDPAWTNLAP